MGFVADDGIGKQRLKRSEEICTHRNQFCFYSPFWYQKWNARVVDCWRRRRASELVSFRGSEIAARSLCGICCKGWRGFQKQRLEFRLRRIWQKLGLKALVERISETGSEALVEEDIQKLDFNLWARIAETGFWAFGEDWGFWSFG